MKTTLSTSYIAYELHSDENANWSCAGAMALAEYLENLEDDTGEEMEFDRVAIRCDFSEFKSLRAWLAEYYGQPLDDALKLAGIDIDDDDDDEIDALIRSHVQDHGQLIEFAGGIIVSSF